MSNVKNAIFCITLALAWPAHAVPPIYNIQENVAPGAVITNTLAPTGDAVGLRFFSLPKMNDYGDIAGQIVAPPGSPARIITHAALWRDGVLQDLGLVGCEETVSICNGRVTAINNIGVASATSSVLKYPSPWGFIPLAPYYEHEAIVVNGYMASIRGNGTEFGWTTDINERGHIVGGSRSTEYVIHNGDYLTHGLIWLSDNLTYEVGGYGQASIANAINNRDQVTGVADFDRNGGGRAFLWQNGTVKDLGTLGGASSEGWDINDQAQIVGESMTTGGARHAFTWLNGVMSDLGTLGGTNSVARALNDAGDIVGYARTLNEDVHAFLWSQGHMYDLNDYLPSGSGWTAVDAYAINRHGEILVRASSGATQRYIILSPPGTVRGQRPVATNVPKDLIHKSAIQYGGTAEDGAYTTASNASGINYTAGYVYSPSVDFDFGAGTDIKTPDMTLAYSSYEFAPQHFVTQTRADGSYGWTVIIGNTEEYGFSSHISNMVTDNDGNVFISGWYANSATLYLNSADGTKTFIANTFSNYIAKYFIAKYNINGKLQWVTTVVSPRGGVVSGLAMDNSGKIYVSGNYNAKNSQSYSFDYRDLFVFHNVGVQYVQNSSAVIRGVPGCNGFVVALDANGKFAGSKLISPAAPDSACVNPLDIAVSSIGELYISGSFTGTVDIDPTAANDNRTQSANGVGENFLVKLGGDGSYAWGMTHAKDHYSDSTGIASDNAGGVYWFDANVYDRSILRRIAASGSVTWTRSVIGDSWSQSYRPRLRVDATGSAYLTGTSYGAKNFDTTSGVDFKYAGSWSTGFVTKWRADGGYAWTLAVDAVTKDTSVDASGNLTVVGSLWHKLDLDPQDGISPLFPYGKHDGYRITFGSAP